MGVKVCCIGNRNDLLGVNGYTYVMMLIVNKMWRKSLKQFCGLGMRSFVKVLNYLLCKNGFTHVVALVADK